MTIVVKLPWPPSVNHIWRMVTLRTRKGSQARMLLSAEGREYRERIGRLLAQAGRLSGRIGVHIVAFPPDKRARDLDNTLKSLIDAIKHAGVIRDDCDIDEILIRRGPVHAGGFVEVELTQIGPADPQNAELFEATA